MPLVWNLCHARGGLFQRLRILPSRHKLFHFLMEKTTISMLSALEENQSYWLKSLQGGLTERLNSPSVKKKKLTFFTISRGSVHSSQYASMIRSASEASDGHSTPLLPIDGRALQAERMQTSGLETSSIASI